MESCLRGGKSINRLRHRMNVFFNIQKHKLSFSVLVLLFISFFMYGASVSLSEAAQEIGAHLFWDPISGNGVFEKNGHNMSFKIGEPLVLLDYSQLAITDAPENRDGVVFVTDGFIKMAEDLFKTQEPSAYYRVGAILIDPGHGGKDSGAVGGYTKDGKKVTLKEKDVALEISLLLAEQLRKNYPDKKILLTRSNDTFLDLEERVDMANSVKLEPHEAIIYISVHINASVNKDASGFEVWYLNPDYRRDVIQETEDNKDVLPILNSMLEEEYTTESILIAKFIMDGLESQIGEQSSPRGIKAEEWFVVRNANMPSVLVEACFITNEKEAQLLDSEEYLRKVSLGIYNGLVAFITHFEQSRGFTGVE